jgi:integrase
MATMGWSSTNMANRYQHITNSVRRTIAVQVGGHLWEQAEGRDQREEPPTGSK